MKHCLKNIILIFCGLIFLPAILFPQEKNFLNKLHNERIVTQEKRIFSEIENDFAEGSVSKISNLFNAQTYFSLSNGVSGYYSSNQAFYILQEFFKIHQVISFRFSNIYSDTNYPYATGNYFYEHKGKRESAKVFVALKRIGNNLKITQITIN
ncbi:MAG TPA: DUF4783 domain-containing protein [Ignavibacteriaceae bacterium]|nr:DUF4783 domain-containing protein [Ignavibacteriaceae bacterium]